MTDAATLPPDGVWTRLRRRPLALFGLVLVVVIVGAAILARWIAPYDPFEQHFDGLTLYGEPLPSCWARTFWAATC